MSNGSAVQNNAAGRDRQNFSGAVILQLMPMNSTFERKIITIPCHPDVVRIGRQTNQKTVPTPHNGYFDSKVLSRQHAEVYADHSGRIFIRDVKSSNGTFVNGMRLSQENKESEPRELREHDVLELGIDIVSEDQKTVVHHKVAAKVEHAGIYQPGNDPVNFADLDSGAGALPIGGPQMLKRAGSQGSINGRLNGNGGPPANMIVMQQPQLPKWLNPITTEHIARKITTEQKLIEQQSADLRRARELIEKILGGKVEPSLKSVKGGSEKLKISPSKGRMDIRSHFTEPPVPPPQAPLPEKPDVLRALADPVIQPLLRRSDTAKTSPINGSMIRNDHSSDIIRLCEELKLAKGELTTQSKRMKTLESELAQERTARESAEERAERLERAERRDSPTNHESQSSSSSSATYDEAVALRGELERVQATVDEMKSQMEAYRRRAENAESDRDQARHSLAELIEQKRKENADLTLTLAGTRPSSSSSNAEHAGTIHLNGRAHSSSSSSSSSQSKSRTFSLSSPTSTTTSDTSFSSQTSASTLFSRAGLDVDSKQPITQDQARLLARFLAQEVFSKGNFEGEEKDALALLATLQAQAPSPTALAYYGVPYGSFAAVVLLGVVAMGWVNGWAKVER
jgi:hypothetical protein